MTNDTISTSSTCVENSYVEDKRNALLLQPATKTRHLKKDKLLTFYTPEEVQKLTNHTEGYYTDASELLYGEAYDNLKEELQQEGKRRVWTWAEDEFLRKNYKHLSDSTIGLALNIPSRVVYHRRQALGLLKARAYVDIPVIIWHNREDYEKDCKEFKLTKARGV